MAEIKKEKKGLGRGLSALISNPISGVNSYSSNNAALNVNEIFAKNFEKEKEKEAQLKSKSEKKLTLAKDNTKTNAKDSESVITNKTIDNSSKEQLLINDKNINFIPIEKIITNLSQPREEFSQKALNELSISIKKHGVLQPILVREVGENYEIVAGERRYRAAKLAGLNEVPIILKKLEEDDAYEIAVIENIQRENLNPIEEAKAYKKLMENGKISQNELAEKIGKDRSTIANLLRILDLPQEVQEMIKNKNLSLGHAKVLLSLKKVEAQKSFAKKVFQDGLSVRELEKLVSEVWVLDAGKVHKDSANSEKKSNDSLKFSEIIDLLRRKLGTRVNIKHQKNGKGKIEIEYYSEDELDRVVQEITKDMVDI